MFFDKKIKKFKKQEMLNQTNNNAEPEYSSATAGFQISAELLSGVTPLKVSGMRTVAQSCLYTMDRPEKKPVTITAIPYYAWGNRGLNEMRVWLPEE